LTPAANGAPVVLYDGVCALCNGTVRFVLRRDPEGRFRFAPLQGSFARQALKRHGKEAGDLDTMYVLVDCGTPSERLLARSDGILFLLCSLGGVWKILAASGAVVPRVVRDRIYGFVVRRRYRWFGKYDTCPLPDASVRQRFLDLD
jgi:predicted DCC family thiol-disulfide oxidoreductase YuxK